MTDQNNNTKDKGKKDRGDERAGILRTLASGWTSSSGGSSGSSGQASNSGSEDRSTKSDASAARDLLITLITRAGKGKDEVIQVLGREIGTALVALLKQPVQELFKNQRLQITLELVPKSAKDSPKKLARRPSKAKSSTSRK